MSVIEVIKFFRTLPDDAVLVRRYLNATICKTRHELYIYIYIKSKNNVFPRIEDTRCIIFASQYTEK